MLANPEDYIPEIVKVSEGIKRIQINEIGENSIQRKFSQTKNIASIIVSRL